MTEYYSKKLEEGLEYQDFIADELRKRGIFLGAYSSSKYQKEKGESCSGIEVKYDQMMRKTGNLYIETAEKPSPDCPHWYPSSIYRDKNTWAFLIGDYEEAFLFSTKQLRHVCDRSDHELKQNHIRRVETPTSKGILLPVEDYVKKTSILILYFTFNKNDLI